MRYCITGHYRQAQTLLRRTKEIEHLYEELLQIVRRNGLPERTTLGLLEAAIGHRVRNASYRVSADVSNNLASRDLKALVDSGLLVAEGKRGRYYIASVEIKALRARTRLLKRLDDPFAIPESAQPSLF